MAKLQVTPVPEKLAQLRKVLTGRFGQMIWQYTVHSNGTITLHASMKGILDDVVRSLEKDGLVTV